jgi:hypothetical protein
MVKDSREIGWNISGDISFDWKLFMAKKRLIAKVRSFGPLSVHCVCSVV